VQFLGGGTTTKGHEDAIPKVSPPQLSTCMFWVLATLGALTLLSGDDNDEDNGATSEKTDGGLRTGVHERAGPEPRAERFPAPTDELFSSDGSEISRLNLSNRRGLLECGRRASSLFNAEELVSASSDGRKPRLESMERVSEEALPNCEAVSLAPKP